MIIALSGFMGCGKSSVGRELAKLTQADYADLDNIIEQTYGRSIPDIFSEFGEDGFRDFEYICLKNLLSNLSSPLLILSLGGGTVINPKCAELLEKYSTTQQEKEVLNIVYLETSAEEIAKRLLSCDCNDRPVLKKVCSERNTEKSLLVGIQNLLASRKDIYKKTATSIICTDGKSPKEIAKVIVETTTGLKL